MSSSSKPASTSKSAAEFFSENSCIAGFDNPGKSLFTTLRELVENSLDACESLKGCDPKISVNIEEIDIESWDKDREFDSKVDADNVLSFFETGSTFDVCITILCYSSER